MYSFCSTDCSIRVTAKSVDSSLFIDCEHPVSSVVMRVIKITIFFFILSYRRIKEKIAVKK